MSRKKRLPPLLLAPKWSAQLYVRIAERDIALFRFLLEAQDHLGYMSVIDFNAAVLKVVFSPHQEKEMRDYLESMRQTVTFSVVERPKGMPEVYCQEQPFKRMDDSSTE